MEKVLLGMSGGVDSSVSAIILKQKGYEVIGATMLLCPKDNEQSIQDAKKVCEKLGIKHITIDAKEEFKNYVINNFICEYKDCKTPNPCIECNKYLKFGLFYNKAIEMGCNYIATGHYAKIEFNEKLNQYILKKSESDKKDQTYFLYEIKKEILPNILLPLENFTNKDDIRKIAEENELIVAKKKDSQDVCFIEDNDYIKFIQENDYNKEKENNKFKTGNIVLKDGTILGKHNGLINYTIGQRKGLGISYKQPLYVIKLNKEKNEVVVGIEEELYSKELIAEKCNFLIDLDFSKEIEVMAKVRYRSKESEAILKYDEKSKIAYITFKEKQRAITPGQAVVFYKDDIVLGGGKIK